jgi:hypothetical protein
MPVGLERLTNMPRKRGFSLYRWCKIRRTFCKRYKYGHFRGHGIPSELANVMAAWEALPAAIQSGIIVMVKASTTLP